MNTDPLDKLEAEVEHSMPLTTDFTLLILKGHLLVEAQLDRLITRMCEKPAMLDEARLSFFQKFCLTVALVNEDPADDDFWQKLRTLNKLRNQLAHRLEVENIDAAAQAFVGAPPDEWMRWTLHKKAVALREELIGICVQLIHFVDELFQESRLSRLFQRIETRICDAEKQSTTKT